MAAARWQWRGDDPQGYRPPGPPLRHRPVPMTPQWAKGVCPTRCVRPLPHWAGVRQQTAKSRHCHAGEQQHTSTRWAQWTPTTVATSRDAFLRCWPLVSGSACAPWAHHSPDYCGPHVCLPALTPTTGSLSMALAPADDASPHPSAIRRPLLQFDADGTFLVTPSAMIIVSCFITSSATNRATT